MNKTRHFAIVLLITLLPMVMRSQNMTIRAPEQVTVDEPFSVTFEVNARSSDHKWPSFKGLSYIAGPMKSFSSSTSIINGHRSTQTTESFTFTLRADSEGTFTIGAAHCTAGGKQLSTQPRSIRAVKGSSTASRNQASNAPSRQQTQQPITQIGDKDLFIKSSVSKTNPYQGEQIIVTYKIYTRVPVQNFYLDKLPGNKGFWSEDITSGQQMKVYDETIDGKQYKVGEIRRGALFAQESGALSIESLSMEVDAIIDVPARRRQRTGSPFDFFDDFFDDAFFNRQQAVKKRLTSNRIGINVKPLPQRPDGYAGAVGSFNIKTSIDSTHTRANEAITFHLTVEGKGNLPLLETPRVNFPREFEVYDPRVTDNFNRSESGISGSRTYEWVLIPRTQGTFHIPDVNYIVFNPATGSYQTLHSQPKTITVDKGNAISMQSGRSDVALINDDINHAKLQIGSIRDNRSISWWQWILAIMIPLTGVAVTATMLRQQGMSDKQRRLHNATRNARKRLRKAEQHLNDNNDNAFYEEIYKALWGCIADKYGIDRSQLSRETVEQHLSMHNIPSETRNMIMTTIGHVDMARFAPNGSNSQKQDIYNQTLQTIAAI